MDDVTFTRVYDSGRGAFCGVNKQGHPLFGTPPTKRDPVANRQTNPRGVRHIGKTQQDHLPVDQRARVQAARKRVAK